MTDSQKKVSKWTEQAIIESGPDGDNYVEYMKEHRKKLKRLEREASGKNTHEPPDGDY